MHNRIVNIVNRYLVKLSSEVFLLFLYCHLYWWITIKDNDSRQPVTVFLNWH